MHAPRVACLVRQRLERFWAVRALESHALEVLGELHDYLIVVIRDQRLESILLQCI